MSLNSFDHNGQAFKSVDCKRSKVYSTILANDRHVYLQSDYKLIRPASAKLVLRWGSEELIDLVDFDNNWSNIRLDVICLLG